MGWLEDLAESLGRRSAVKIKRPTAEQLGNLSRMRWKEGKGVKHTKDELLGILETAKKE